MKISRYFNLLLLLTISVSWPFQAQQINDGAVTFNSFPIERTITSLNSFSLTESQIDKMTIYNDSILMFVTMSSSYKFLVYDILNEKELGYAVKSGTKNNEVMGFISFGAFGSDFWVYDMIKSKVILYDYNSLLTNTDQGVNTYQIDKFYYSTQLINKQTMLVSGDYDSEYWFSIYDLSNGKIREDLVPYVRNNSDTVSKAIKTAYESFLYVKPDKSRAVLAARYADRIQIVNLDTKESKVIKGPDNYDPDMVLMKDNLGEEIYTRGPNTQYAFVSGTTTNKYIYLLYSGNNHNGTHRWYGKYIYKYDWDGNPIERLELPEYTLDFAVTSGDRIIYTYDPEDEVIKTGELGLD